jgi:tetratricopeptide (TPR) repeat protein
MGLMLSLLLAAAAAATPSPPTNAAPAALPFAVPTPHPEDPVEKAYEALLKLDDQAQEELDRWIREADAAGPRADAAALQSRINERIGAVDRAYSEFLDKHPRHVRARVAYGSFLNDTGRDGAAREEWEQALKLDPKNPAIYNNLATYYGHRGPVTNAFVHYEKAIELAPDESLYYHNFGTTVFLFRRDVMEHYKFTDEQKVFDKALALYEKAVELDPDNFILASDVAQTYYGIKPPRHDQALAAWRRAYELASDDLERQAVRVHFARIQVQAGRFDDARSQLSKVDHPDLSYLRGLVQRTLERKESELSATNSPGAQP